MSRYLKKQEPSLNFEGRVIKNAKLVNCEGEGGGGGGGAENAVLYTSQSLTTEQKAQARTNIGAASASDVTGKADKVSGGTENNFAALDANGNLKDSGHKHSDYLTSHQDISGKADKVSGGTSGNFASLDGNGNLADSGKKASDFLTSHQDISGKADKVSSPTNGNFAGLDSNGNLTDSGKKASDFLTQHQDITGKEDKSNKVTSLSSQSTDTQYPSAKCVYDLVGDVETLLAAI